MIPTASSHADHFLHDCRVLAGMDGGCREVAVREGIHRDGLLGMLFTHILQYLQPSFTPARISGYSGTNKIAHKFALGLHIRQRAGGPVATPKQQ